VTLSADQCDINSRLTLTADMTFRADIHAHGYCQLPLVGSCDVKRRSTLRAAMTLRAGIHTHRYVSIETYSSRSHVTLRAEQCDVNSRLTLIADMTFRADIYTHIDTVTCRARSLVTLRADRQ